MRKKFNWISVLIVCLLAITSICGIMSLNFGNSHEVINQYGDVVKIYGSGIYAGDSYFKAPLSIGADICVLIMLIPLYIIRIINLGRDNSNINRLKLYSLHVVSLYYSASIAIGVKYNRLHLIYILLFSCSLFAMFLMARTIERENLKFKTTKGVNIFLVICGIAVIVAWMPDIIPTVFTGNSLKLIEVYTTETTYVLDMGIIAPLCFMCIYFLKNNDPIGVIILTGIVQLCIFVGIMIIPQSICQILSGANLPIPVIITKGASFIALGGFAYYFHNKIYKELREAQY